MVMYVHMTRYIVDSPWENKLNQTDIALTKLVYGSTCRIVPTACLTRASVACLITVTLASYRPDFNPVGNKSRVGLVMLVKILSFVCSTCLRMGTSSNYLHRQVSVIRYMHINTMNIYNLTKLNQMCSQSQPFILNLFAAYRSMYCTLFALLVLIR